MSFESDLGNFSVKLEKISTKTVRKVTFEAYKLLTELTPVKTGRAKNNWFVQAGSPSGETTDETSGKPKDVAVETGRMLSELNKIDGSENDIYISNNLDYIIALEHGHSLQEPAGMMAITLEGLKAYIESGKFKG